MVEIFSLQILNLYNKKQTKEAQMSNFNKITKSVNSALNEKADSPSISNPEWDQMLRLVQNEMNSISYLADIEYLESVKLSIEQRNLKLLSLLLRDGDTDTMMRETAFGIVLMVLGRRRANAVDSFANNL